MERSIQGDPSIYSENVSHRVKYLSDCSRKTSIQKQRGVELSSNINVRNEVRPGLAGLVLTSGENVSYGVHTHWTILRGSWDLSNTTKMRLIVMTIH